MGQHTLTRSAPKVYDALELALPTIASLIDKVFEEAVNQIHKLNIEKGGRKWIHFRFQPSN